MFEKSLQEMEGLDREGRWDRDVEVEEEGRKWWKVAKGGIGDVRFLWDY